MRDKYGSEIFFLPASALWLLCLKFPLPLFYSSLSYESEILLRDFKSQHFHESEDIPVGFCFRSWTEE